jgi:hypothetical protein
MTIQSVLMLTGIVSAFLMFGFTLAWADFYTRQGPKPAIGQPHDVRKAPPQQNSFEQRRAA